MGGFSPAARESGRPVAGGARRQSPAATLRGLRVSRIAIHPSRQREGLGRKMIADIAADAAGYDYLSVSFGYTAELWRFWQRCGFTLVRLGTHREASSCYTAMALYPLTAAGASWRSGRRSGCSAMNTGFARGEESAPLPASQTLCLVMRTGWKRRALLRPPPAGSGAGLPQPPTDAGRHAVAGPAGRLQGKEEAALCAVLQLTGRKALQARWRREAADALRSLMQRALRRCVSRWRICNF